jgi:hypothetical protein
MWWTRHKAVIAVAAVIILAGLVVGLFTTASGQRMTFATGQAWVVLAYR